MKTDLFQSCGHCWVFQTCWHIECRTFTASSFRIWNSSTGILSPPLALFVNYHTIALITHTSKVMLKILQARLQQYMNCEITDVQPGLRKGKGTRDQIPNIQWVMENAREFQKTSISALLTMPKPLTLWITINCWKFWKRWEYQITWPASWETCMKVRKQQLELDMEQYTDSK